MKQHRTKILSGELNICNIKGRAKKCRAFYRGVFGMRKMPSAGAGSDLYRVLPQRPPPPLTLKIAKFARGDPKHSKCSQVIPEKAHR